MNEVSFSLARRPHETRDGSLARSGTGTVFIRLQSGFWASLADGSVVSEAYAQGYLQPLPSGTVTITVP